LFPDRWCALFSPPVVIPIGTKHINGADAIDYVQVAAVLPHPDFRHDSEFELEMPDIMLIKLDRPSIAPIRKWNDDPFIPLVGENLTAVGFGRTSTDGDFPEELLQTENQVVGYEDCRVKHDEDFFRDETVFCAGTLLGGKSTCNGDSGGPVFDGKGTIVGLTSARPDEGCALPDDVSYNTRVSYYAADFIRKGICQLSENPPADCPTETGDMCSDIFRCNGSSGSGRTMHRSFLGRCFNMCVTTRIFNSLLECGPCGTYL
jgi:hypothetical protein